MLRIYSLISGVVFFLLAPCVHAQTYGSLQAIDDATTTGPMQSVRMNVIANDTMPCTDSYTWRIITVTDLVKEGITEKRDDYLIFKPSFACRDTTLHIEYAIKCSNHEDTAIFTVTVTNYNRPINVLPPDLKCWIPSSENTLFNVSNKFNTNIANPTHNHKLLVYSLPLVGDLNGDMKPEILAIGLLSSFAQVTASARYIIIMDGQTGKTLVEFDTECEFAVSSDQPDASAYHSSPSYMAIADVDNDGKGEIIMAFPEARNVGSSIYANDKNAAHREQVFAYKVVTNSANVITGLQQYWKAPVGYKMPLTTSTSTYLTGHLIYDVPVPYIADLNGDGIPEVIVYNKIYNAQTGRLLMAWDGATATPKASSITAGTGLLDYENGSIYTDQATSNTVYNRAFVGRRPSTSIEDWKDDYIAVFAVENMDDDEDLEVIAGNRIYKFQFSYLGKDGELGSHTDNTYTTIEGPRSVTIPTTGSDNVTYYLSDGFTRVADIDGDGHLDVINISEIATTGGYGSRAAGLITVWDPRCRTDLSLDTIKAASVFYGNGGVIEHIPTFGIPFIGDINGKVDGGWDGTQFTKKLPEIGLITGSLYINSSNDPKRNGITFHPLTDEKLRRGVGWDNNNTSALDRRFNNPLSGVQGHIFAVTYCDSAGMVPFHRRLKLSWAMEHKDRSANTGLTIFDLNNDGAKDLIYRDEETLRVISPKYGENDYVDVNETETTSNTSVMFRTPAYSYTAYEAAIVADVNMDASANIVVTNTESIDRLDGWISVFEYAGGTDRWAPAPPVWNQAYYNPRHIREDLTVPSRPTPILTEYLKDEQTGEMIQPYNNVWEQQYYVRDGDPYTPVVRLPDAALVNMTVTVDSTTKTEVTLTIRNRGSASIAANMPITFYDGDNNPGKPLEQSAKIETQTVAVDIFPGESVLRTYTLPASFNGNDRLIWARIMDNGGTFPDPDFADCVSENNTASGAYCPDMKYDITSVGDLVICGNDSLTLIAIPVGTVKYDRTYQWFLNETVIKDATDSIYTTSIPGNYTCYVTEGICRQYTPSKKVITRFMEAYNDSIVAIRGIITSIRVLANDTIPSTCNPEPAIETPPAHGTAVVAGNNIHYMSNAAYLGTDEFTYSIADDVTATVYIHVIDIPGNIVEADCKINPPHSPFSLKQLAISDNTDSVYSVATPLIGDIDNDGITEMVVVGGNYPNTSYDIKIYEFKNNRIELQQRLPVPGINGIYAAPFSIANVDGNGYAAIFLCTRRDLSDAADRGQLIKYTFNGTRYEKQHQAEYSSVSAKEGGIPYIADFNGDGRAEVVVYDKVFDAQTLTLLANGNFLDNTTMGFGSGGYPVAGTNYGSYMAVGDLDGNGLPEIAAGDCVYKVHITNSSGTSGNSFTLWSRCDGKGPDGKIHGDVGDGPTTIADMDGDGLLDVIVTVKGSINALSDKGSVYVWNPRTKRVIHENPIDGIAVKSPAIGPSVPLAGDIDNDGEPEICFTGSNKIYAFGYDARTKTLRLKWSQNASGDLACVVMSLFDFNQDGSAELVYRDKTHLRILNGVDGTTITEIVVKSETGNEYPVVADVNNDGMAEIAVTGYTDKDKYGHLFLFSCDPAGRWAPAREVWNQFQYNAVNVNDDLTIPPYQLNPATVFPGKDGMLDTDDEVRPYNTFLQQQTVLDKNGMPVWLAPDARPDSLLTTSSIAGNSVTINVGIVNQGDAVIGPPVYVTLYNDNTTQKITSNSADIQISPGDTGYVSVTIDDITQYNPAGILIRVNDAGSTFLYQSECDSMNNDLKILNPAIYHKKEATFEGVQNNGAYANPVSILYNEALEYKITAINANLFSGTVFIVDTLPAFLNYETGTVSDGGIVTQTSGTPARDIINWTITGVPSMAPKTVSFKAMPVTGVCASQPLFVNKAWVATDATRIAATNETYHQGAGAGVVTFSAGIGGNIYNAEKQVLDYRTKPEGGVIIVPDEGYLFAGWSYDDYISLKGKLIGGRKGIMRYDTLTVYGDVELHAAFELEEYPIHYYLNGAEIPGNNPLSCTVKSEAITLEAPEKEGDVFIGWTGSNGDEPQQTVTIPEGSTGELYFYANFLYSGHENAERAKMASEDMIWATMDKLHIRTNKTGNIVKIYTADGILRESHTILSAGETKIELPQGLYIVTLNNSIARKISIK